MSYSHFSLPHRNSTRKQRGSILFLTLVFLVLINLFAVAFWKMVPVELHSAKRHMLETEAYFASDAGIIDCVAFLERATNQGNLDNFINNNGVTNADGHLVLQRSGEIAGWEWEAEIIPGPDTFGHNEFLIPNPLRVFKIEAAAKRPGIMGNSHQYRKVTAWVRQRSFADPNWSIPQTGPPTSNPLWLFMDTFTLGGDYFTSGKGLLRIEDSSIWSNPEPAIKGDFVFAEGTENPTLGYVDGVQYSNWGSNFVPYFTTGPNVGQPRGTRYEKLTANGRAGVRNGDAVEMPQNTDSIAYGVWGTDPPAGALLDSELIFGAGSDVRLTINDATLDGPARNGIWLDGDVAQIEFRTNTNNPEADPDLENQIIRIYQDTDPSRFVEVIHITGQPFQIPDNPGVTVLGTNHAPGETLMPGDNSGRGYTVVRNASTNEYAVFTEQTNGAIFSSGDINGVRGIVKGRRTVGVSTDTGANTARDRNIRINGEILYAGTPPGEPPSTSDTMLGLIGYSVRMVAQGATAAPTEANPQFNRLWPTRQATSPANPHYLYCSIFAGRDQDPAYGLSGNGPILQGGGFGSVSPDNTTHGQGHLYVFGSITEGIRQWKGTGNNAGNSYAFDLDPHLKQIQPPFFPALPVYDIVAWEEQSLFSY